MKIYKTIKQTSHSISTWFSGVGLVLALLTGLASASAPAWTVDGGSFSGSANVRAVLIVDEILSGNSQNILGAFVGEECRGVVSPVFILNSWKYFLTVYSDTAGEEISFKAYVQDEDLVVPVTETITFADGSNYGSAYFPMELNVIIYLDHDPVVGDIPDQIIFEGDGFSVIELDNFLTELDGDDVEWSYSGNTELSVSLENGSQVTVSVPGPTWTGSESITFQATDMTENAKFAQESVSFTVLPVDHAPIVADIPDQLVSFGDTFPLIDLNYFLTEMDGDNVEWHYSFMPPLIPDPVPDWTLIPGDYELSMNLTTKVIARGQESQGPNNILAAFSGNECRGVVSPIYTIDSWVYFLTIFSNTNGEEITFRYYDFDQMIEVPVVESYLFTSNVFEGSPLNPEVLLAELIRITIDAENMAGAEVIDPDWTGSETVIFTATDMNTLNSLHSSDYVTYSYSGLYDLPPFLWMIPAQTINEGDPFASVDLNNYVLEIDGDNLNWSAGGNTELLVNVSGGNFLEVSAPDPDWFGSEEIIVIVADDTQSHLSDVTTVVFTVLSVNDAPVQISPLGNLNLDFPETADVQVDVFSDVENDQLSYSIQSSDDSMVPVVLVGTTAVITAAGSGTATVTVTADDGNGGQTEAFFQVTVNCLLTVDCNGACGGLAYQDGCGECVAGNTGVSAGWAEDCNGDCFGVALEDGCGICSGGESGHIAESDRDCNNDCFGTALLDDCQICSGGNSEHSADSDKDCNGDCFGAALADSCGICSGGESGHTAESDRDCNDDCFGTAQLDDCQTCSGGNSGHTPNSDIDVCNVCPDGTIGENSNEPAPEGYAFLDGPDCNDDCFGTAVLDACEVCAGGQTGRAYNSDDGNGFITGPDADCAGDCFGLADNDDCGVCSGGNSQHLANSDKDCAGDCFGSALLDDCEICSGGNSDHIADSDKDCAGDCFGSAILDDCQVCSGGNTGHGFNSDLDECNVCPDGSMGMGSDEPAPGAYSFGDGPDCNDDCFGTAFRDDCQVCSGGNSGHEANSNQDCSGDCFGPALEDECGVCSGGYSQHIANSDMDCNGDCFGEAVLDDCQVCSGGFSEHVANSDMDCNGDCYGTAAVDDCQICSGGFSEHTANSDIDECNICPDGTYGLGSNDPAPEGYAFQDGSDCYGDCFGSAFEDACGSCAEGNTGIEANIDDGTGFVTGPDADCAGDCFGSAGTDDCGVCSGGNSGNLANSDMDCAGDCFGSAVLDSCEVCSEGNSGHVPDSDQDCNGDCFGVAMSDDCGICSGGNSDHLADSDKDCAGDCFGQAFSDDCGICSGGNSDHLADSDKDCAGTCFGSAVLDSCDVCSEGDSGHVPDSDQDCNGDCFGQAFSDDCGVCSGGNSDHIADSDKDCSGDCFGSAVLDNCLVCSGGNSGHEADSDLDSCNTCPDGTVGVGSNDLAPDTYLYGDGPDCNGDCFGAAFENECGCVEGDSGIDELYCYGCMDPTAINYYADAIFEDSSCVYFGDFSGDGIINVSDIVQMVNVILFPADLTELQLLTGDMNNDGIISVIDLVMIIDIILSNPARTTVVQSAMLEIGADRVKLLGSSGFAGLQFSTEGNYSELQSQLPAGWEMHAAPGIILIFSMDGSALTQETLFTYSGEIEITDIILADWQGQSHNVDVQVLPEQFVVGSAYPNPFNPTTIVPYFLPESGGMEVIVYDLKGSQVAVLAGNYQSSGWHEITWDASGYSSGVYFMRFSSENMVITQKLFLLK